MTTTEYRADQTRRVSNSRQPPIIHERGTKRLAIAIELIPQHIVLFIYSFFTGREKAIQL